MIKCSVLKFSIFKKDFETERLFFMHFKKHFIYKWLCRGLLVLTTGCLFFSQSLIVSAELSKEERIATQQAMTVQSNEVENWPTGPVVTAESAILMEADTGTILYAKNIHKQQYPASTTKILTTLIASEQCELDEWVDFSQDAVFDIDRGSNHIAIDVGQRLTMEDCLNAILIRSANEVSLAVAEHISGGAWEDFAPLMNERAKELGCLNSNFVNPNGLPNEEHVTTAYDLAMIGRAFFANEALCKITTTRMLHILPTEYQPYEKMEVNKMELIPGGKYAYEYLVGCKTGYTDAARSTLVSCAEKDGMKLICVVLKDENPYQYEDTVALFEYGFSNFEKVNVSQTETKYNIDNAGSFYSEKDIFGSSKPILSLNQDDCIILPKTVGFEETESTISYDTQNEKQAALITYTYHDIYIGSASVDLAASQENAYIFESITEPSESDEKEPSFIFINVVKILIAAVVIVVLILAAFVVRAILKNYQFSHRSTRRSWRKERRRRQNHYQSVNNSIRAQRREQIRQAKRRQRRRKQHKFRDYD